MTNPNLPTRKLECVTAASIAKFQKTSTEAINRARRLGSALWDVIDMAKAQPDAPARWLPVRPSEGYDLAELQESRVTPHNAARLTLRIPTADNDLKDTPAWLEGTRSAKLEICAHESPIRWDPDCNASYVLSGNTHWCDEDNKASVIITPRTDSDVAYPERRDCLYTATLLEGSPLQIADTELVIDVLRKMTSASE